MILKNPPSQEKGINEWIEIDWKNEFVNVNDGGNCFWKIIINIDKKSYEDFMVNGIS